MVLDEKKKHDKIIHIGTNLTSEMKIELIQFL